MALHTFESPRAAGRLTGQVGVLDTSYLVALLDPNDTHFLSAITFHRTVSGVAADFVLSLVVRQEFLKRVRKNLLIGAALSLAASDPAIEARYRRVLRTTRPLTVQR